MGDSSVSPSRPRPRWLDGREEVREFSSLETASRELGPHSCYFTVKAGNREPLDFQWDYRGLDSTLVLFHAALPATVSTLPVFLGRRVSENVQANRLFVADPAHYCSGTSIGAGWFMGTSSWPSYQRELGLFFADIQRRFGRRAFVLFGPSAGGFASLFYSALLPRSIAVPVNPQTDASEFNGPVSDALAREVWGVPRWRYDPMRYVPAVKEVVSSYSRPTLNQVLYLQNRQDSLHVREHFGPFQASSHTSNDITFVMGDWGRGHKPAPGWLVSRVLQSLCSGAPLSALTRSLECDEPAADLEVLRLR